MLVFYYYKFEFSNYIKTTINVNTLEEALVYVDKYKDDLDIDYMALDYTYAKDKTITLNTGVLLTYLKAPKSLDTYLQKHIERSRQQDRKYLKWKKRQLGLKRHEQIFNLSREVKYLKRLAKYGVQ